MNMLKVKKSITLLVGMMTITAFSGIAQAAETRFAVQDSTGTTDKMVVTDGGRIGINTSTPDTGINIKTNLVNDAKIRSQLTTTVWYDSAGMEYFKQNPNGGTDQLPLNTDRLGNIVFGSTISGVAKFAAGIFGSAGGNWSATSLPTFITFETTDVNSTARMERMRVASNGNIGVGVTAPTQKIEVNGGIKYNASGLRPACDATTRGTTWFVKGVTNVADTFSVCAKDALENYSWKTLF